MIFSPNIIEFIKNNFNNRLIVNELFLEKFKCLTVQELGLNSYLQKIRLEDLRKLKAVALYNKKEVLIDQYGVEKDLELKSIDINERTLTFNFYASLLHELIHVIQKSKYQKMKSPTTFELCLLHSELVKNGYIHLNLKDNKISKKQGTALYLKYGTLFPMEREANIISWSLMLSIYKDIYSDYRREIEQLNTEYLDLIFDDYNLNSESPLEKFYNLIGRHDIFESLDFSEYSVYEKCLYGMPLTIEEKTYEEKSLKLL